MRGSAGLCRAIGVVACLWGGFAVAQVPPVLKIGVLTDFAGSTADSAGQGSVVAARLAAEDGLRDAAGALRGVRIEVLSGSNLAKPDVALTIARQWLDQEGVAAIADLPYSNVALAMSALGAERDRAVLIGSAATSDLTGRACNAVTTQWTDDSYMLATGTARTLAKAGRKTWFFVTADYAFGQAMQRDATAAIEAEGGTVLGAVRHPLPSPDMSSFMTQAIASRAQVIGLANVGADTTNAVREAASFGLRQGGQQLAGFLVFINDVHSLGLAAAQGLLVTSGYYWDANDASRAFAERFRSQMGRPPAKPHAAVYASVRHWLRAVDDTASVSGAVTTRAMNMTSAEYFGQTATVRADGRVLYDLQLYQVKTPAESRGPWDYYKPVATLPRDDTIRPLAEGGCKMVGG